MQLLLSDCQLVRKFGEGAREYTENELSPEKHYESMMEIYEKVINNCI